MQKSNNIHQSCVDFNVLILAQRSNMDKDELRAVIKYLYRNGKSAIEIQKVSWTHTDSRLVRLRRFAGGLIISNGEEKV